MQPQSSRTPLVVTVALAGIGLIGLVDYLTGVEYRIFVLYYLPLGLAAWQLGHAGALAAATLCAVSWLASNYLAGLQYSSSMVWGVNFAMQGVSFVIVGLLVATIRGAFLRAYQLSRTDPLTSLLNSRAFTEEAARVVALAERHRHPVSLAYLDLDDFKAVNDTLGHDRGDDLLRATADVLRRSIRSGDVAARVGGDEFVILLPETAEDGARRLIERLRTALTDSLRADRPAITASIGVASFLDAPFAVEELLRKADALMYEAKRAGKNGTRFEVAAASEPAAGEKPAPTRS